MNTKSLEISNASKEKIEENENVKTNELILNCPSSKTNKSNFSKSLFVNTNNKINNDESQKGKVKANLSLRLKLEKDIDTSNRVENDSSSSSDFENKSKISDIKKESEKFVMNSFSNLSKTNEKSFQINSIYENLNNLSNNKYGSNLGLQLKIKNVLIEESNSLTHSYSKKNNNFSRIQKRKSQIIGNKILSKFSTVKSLNNFADIEEEKKSANSLNESKLQSYRSSNRNKESKIESYKTSKKEEEQFTENLSMKKFESCKKFILTDAAGNNYLNPSTVSKMLYAFRKNLEKEEIEEIFSYGSSFNANPYLKQLVV